MAENTWFAASPGDTVLGTIRNTFGNLPQVEIDRMLEEFERLNKRPAGDIKSGEHYILPSSTWHRDRVGERFGPDELLEVISAGAAYRNKALGRVNSWRELTGLGPATFNPSTLASSMRAHSTATDKDIQDRVIAQALAEGFAKIEQLEPWFTRRGYDKVFLKDTAAAVRAQLGEKRSAESEKRAGILFPYQLEKTMGEYDYRQGASERGQVVDNAISKLTKGFTVKPGSDIKDPDPEKAYSQMIARLIALGTNTTDLNSARATFEAMNSLMTAEASGTMDENLSRIARDIVSRVAGGELKPTEALSEFNDRTVSYTDKEKKAARETINNFITVARQQSVEERAVDKDIYDVDKRKLELADGRRKAGLPELKKRIETFVLDTMGSVVDRVLRDELEYDLASDTLSDLLRTGSSAEDRPDLDTIKKAQELLMKEIASKKPADVTERTWLRDIQIRADLANLTGKDENKILTDLNVLRQSILDDIKKAWTDEASRGASIRRDAQSVGTRFARRLRDILFNVPENQRLPIWEYFLGTMTAGQRVGWDNFTIETLATPKGQDPGLSGLWPSSAAPRISAAPVAETTSTAASAQERIDELVAANTPRGEIKKILEAEGWVDKSGKPLK